MLKQFRERAGMKPHELAVAIGAHPMTIHRWENGTSDISGHLLVKLQEVLNLSDAETLDIVKGLNKEAG